MTPERVLMALHAREVAALKAALPAAGNGQAGATPTPAPAKHA